jgi:penicillin G amidase
MASWWQKTLAALPTNVIALTGLAGAGYDLLIRRPLPKIKGRLHLQGLHAPVEVITDRYGVPHIYAENEDDLYFAQGYVHAQERLWQMDDVTTYRGDGQCFI